MIYPLQLSLVDKSNNHDLGLDTVGDTRCGVESRGAGRHLDYQVPQRSNGPGMWSKTKKAEGRG